MDAAAEIIAAAREQVDVRTRFQHQARQPGLALDCVGLLIHAFGAAGLAVTDERGYARAPDPAVMRARLESLCDRVGKGEPWQPADILWIRIVHEPQHLALLTDSGSIIHAYSSVGRVVEHGLDARWCRRVEVVYRHRGLNV